MHVAVKEEEKSYLLKKIHFTVGFFSKNYEKRIPSKKNEDFSRIIKRKQSMANRTFIIYYLKNDIGHARIGISVSKKLGKAVIRNKIKRQVRMIIKETINLDDNYDYIVIVRNKFLDLDFISNLKEFNYLYKKILKRMEN